MSNFLLPDVFYQAQNTPKLVGQGSDHKLTQTLFSAGGTNPVSIPFPLDAFGVLILAPQLSGPPIQFLSMPEWLTTIIQHIVCMYCCV